MSFKKAFHFPNTQSIHSSTIVLTNFKTTVFAGGGGGGGGALSICTIFSKLQIFHSLIK